MIQLISKWLVEEGLVREEETEEGKRYDQWFVRRFCRARDCEESRVKEMLRNFFEWRAREGVDDIAQMDISPVKLMFELLPHNYYCADREGRPVYIERYKDFDLKEIYKRVGEDFPVRYYIYHYERTLHTLNPHLSRLAGKRIEQTVTILDLAGLNFSQVLAKRSEIQELLKKTSKIAQDNYPEVMGKLFVVNAPMLFNVMWMLVKGFLNENTVKKISILGSGYKKELTKVVAEDQLPDFLGGTNNNPLQQGAFEHLFE